jgi:hypothetical protein
MMEHRRSRPPHPSKIHLFIVAIDSGQGSCQPEMPGNGRDSSGMRKSPLGDLRACQRPPWCIPLRPGSPVLERRLGPFEHGFPIVTEGDHAEMRGHQSEHVFEGQMSRRQCAFRTSSRMDPAP